jgi:CheY-like chemotaxis protein
MTMVPSEQDPASKLEPPLESARRRVLVVDDNRDAAKSLGRLLALLGKEVCVAHDGPSALAEVARFRPHVVLLDLGMPGMDGLETARRIRALPQWNEMVLVALTGWGQEEDRQRTQSVGFHAHLVKPIHVDELEAALAQLAPGDSSLSTLPPGPAAGG